MMNRESWPVALLAFFTPVPLVAAQGPLAFSVDEKTQSYTITEDSLPVLTYRFGEVPLPAGVEAHHFTKRDTPYNGAYFTDGSRFGGERSDCRTANRRLRRLRRNDGPAESARAGFFDPRRAPESGQVAR